MTFDANWHTSDCEAFLGALVEAVGERRRGAAASTRAEVTVASSMTICDTRPVAKAISVRLDDEAERALRALEASGLSRSEAIRSALLASAERLRRGQQLAAEVAALEADDEDRAEMLSVASLMESLRAPG